MSLFFRICILLTMTFLSFPIYLNFNSIDMKKEVRSRNNNSATLTKRTNQTKHSSKKRHSRKRHPAYEGDRPRSIRTPTSPIPSTEMKEDV